MNELIEAIQLTYALSFWLFVLCLIYDKGPLTVKTFILAIFILAIPILNAIVYLLTFYKVIIEYDIVKESIDFIRKFIKKTGDLITKILNYRIK